MNTRQSPTQMNASLHHGVNVQRGQTAFARRPSLPEMVDDDRMRPVDGEPIGHVLSGELVTETLDYDGGREVTVYVHQSGPGLSCSPAMVG